MPCSPSDTALNALRCRAPLALAVTLALLLMPTASHAQQLRDEADGEDLSAPNATASEGDDDSDEHQRHRAETRALDTDNDTSSTTRQRGDDDASAQQPTVIKPSEGSPYWEDSDRFSASVARGAVGVCEAATLPAALLPGLGTAAAMVLDYLCILPGALTLDYASTHHGDDPDGALLEGALALFASKLWRDITRLPAYIALGVLTSAVVVGLVAFVAGSAILLPLASLWIAVPAALGTAAAAVLSLAMASGWIRDAGADTIFWGVYDGVGDVDDQPEEVARWRPDSAEDGRLDPPLDPCSRCFTLSAVSTGVEAPFAWSHVIPVVGPYKRAQAKRDRLEDDLHRLARDVFKEHKDEEELETIRTTLDVLAITSGTLGALTHVGLGVALVSAVVSLAAAPMVFGFPIVGVPLLIAAGVVALIGGVSGLVFYGAHSLVGVLEAIVIPIAFGAFPDEATPDNNTTTRGPPAAATRQVAQRY